MSGMRPAAAMMCCAVGDIRNLRNCTASFWWLDCLETANPSPEYWTTLCCGWSVNGGRNGATFAPIASRRVAVSQLPSTIIAAWPFMKAPRMFVFVSTSLFVQPFFGIDAQFDTALTSAGAVHGVEPV